MAYSDDKKPDPHYTVQVRVFEVTPSYRSGTGVQAMTHDKQTEEVINVTVRAEDESEAIERAIAMLTTANAA